MPPRKRAAAKTTLRAVSEDEKAPEKAPKTIHDAAEGGSHRDLLVATRSRIAKALDNPNTSPRDLASLSRRLMEIANEIQAIDEASGEGEGGIGAAAGTPDEEFDAEAL